MAVLLAALAIMGIVWMMAVPVWKQAVQREKESELIFRAGQYARAIALYQRKYANAFPPNVDVLLKEKFLRKKYKDPITSGDFRLLSPVELQTIPGMTTAAPGFASRPGMPGPGGTGSAGSTFPRPTGAAGAPSDPATSPGFGTPSSALGPNGPNVGPSAGIAAVVSKSSAASIRIFKNRRQYNQWIVTVEDVSPRRGLGTPQPNQGAGMNPGSGQPRPGMSPGATGFPSRTP